MEGAQIPENLNESVTSAAFAAKFRSKREVYQFLSVDVKAYLPPLDNVTIYFLKDILMRKKRRLNNADIETIHMLHYKCLSLEKVF